MSEAITDAVQIIRLTIEGTELILKFSGASIKAAKKAAKLFKLLLSYEKQMGRTDLKKLLLRGGDLQVLQFDKKDIRTIKKYAKKYGILYSILPELNKESGKVEMLFHSEAVPRMNMLLQKINKESFKVRSVNQFLDETDDKTFAGLEEYLNEQKKGNHDVHAGEDKEGLIEKAGQYAVSKKSISVDDIKNELSIEKEDAGKILGSLQSIGVIEPIGETGNYKVVMDKEEFDEKIKRLKDITERMQMIAMSKDTDLMDITIAKQLIAEENDHAIKTRIPGTWGGDTKYLWIDKKNAMDIYDGKTILSFIDKEKDYKIYSEDNRIIETIKGETLYKNHYDPVSKKVREKYEQIDKVISVKPKRR